jgi:hypothetical protein
MGCLCHWRIQQVGEAQLQALFRKEELMEIGWLVEWKSGKAHDAQGGLSSPLAGEAQVHMEGQKENC